MTPASHPHASNGVAVKVLVGVLVCLVGFFATSIWAGVVRNEEALGANGNRISVLETQYQLIREDLHEIKQHLNVIDDLLRRQRR